MLPMPELGFHTVIYLTFAAALAVATVRALGRDDERTLTGMLAFMSIFGLASGTYYAGRSHPETLVLSFAAWSFALALLTLLVVRQLAAQRPRWPEPAAAACLFAFCLAACSLAQTPAPWTQLDRLATTGEPIFREPRGQPFIAAHVAPGERVAILTHLGHRIGENLGVENVAPYASASSMPTVEQLGETVTALRDEGARKLFLYAKAPYPEMTGELRRAGLTRAATDGEGYELWVDGGGSAASSESPAGIERRAPRSHAASSIIGTSSAGESHLGVSSTSEAWIPWPLPLAAAALSKFSIASRWRTRRTRRTTAAGGSSSELKYVIRSIVQPVSAASERIIGRS
jgi:hypothetical protein